MPNARPRLLSILVAFATALVVVLLPVTSAQAASNPDGCHGYVKNFYKSGGRIYNHYKVVCQREQDLILVTPRILKGGAWYQLSPRRECRHVTFCVGVFSVSDKSGTQSYTAATNFSWLSTAAQRNGNPVACGVMTCSALKRSF